MNEQEKQAVMLTQDDIETLLMVLTHVQLPMPYHFGEAPPKENEEIVKKILHVRKVLMDTKEQ